MSCNIPHFQALLGAVMDTWAKPLIQNKYPEITWFGYTSCDSKHPNQMVDFENHMIYVDCGDTLLDTYEKTQKAYNLIKDCVDFDYVVRTNTSVFINIYKMLERINSVSDDEIISNITNYTVADKNDDIVMRHVLMVGFFMSMSRKFFDIAMSSDVVRERDKFWPSYYHDDVVMSRTLLQHVGKNNLKFQSIEPDENVTFYKPCVEQEADWFEEFRKHFNFEFNNPSSINEHILFRLRPLYEGDERLTRGHELEHFYELNNVLESRF